MFTKTFVLLTVIVIARSDVENCQKVLINSDDFAGDCCVFIENSDVPVAIVVNILKERRQESLVNNNQTSNTSLDSFIKIKSDRIYGRCNVTALYENNNTITKIQDNLPALLNKTLLQNNSSKKPAQFNARNVSSKSFNENLSKPKSGQNKNAKSQQGGNYTHSLGSDTNLEQFETYNSSSTKQYHEKDLVESNNTNSFTTLRTGNQESKHSTAHTPYFTTVIPDQPEERLSGSNESSDIFFPTEQTLETRTTSTNISSVASSGNATGSKSIVDLDNRNAVDVPPLGCPNGQARDPSGTCIAPF